MSMTTKPGALLPKDVAFATMNRAIEKNLPQRTLFNAGEFYGVDYLNLVYVQEFFQRFPEQRKNVVVSVRGCIKLPHFAIEANRQGITESLENVLKYVPDLDIFEPARLDPDTPDYTDVVATLDEAVDAGKIKAYTFSEVSGSTLRKLTQLARHKPVGVEMEYSLMCREILTDTGLVSAAGELDMPIIVYSPIARGLLSGTILSKDDIDPSDPRNRFDRFSAENIAHNREIFVAVGDIAKKKGVTAAQLAIAWVKYHSEKTLHGVKFPKLIPIPSCSSVGRVDENFADVSLTKEEFDALESVIENRTIRGDRYPAALSKYLNV